MLYSLGDYHSTMPAEAGLFIALGAILMLLLVIIVQERRKIVQARKDERIRQRGLEIKQARSSYLSPNGMQFTPAEKRHMATLAHKKEDIL